MTIMRVSTAILLAVTLAACAAGPRVSPIEITRFHQSAAAAQLGAGTVFIENAPGIEADADEIAAFKSAIAAELAQLGYREVSRDQADQIAQVRVERYVAQPAQRRSPVTIGGGGSAGSYGSGVGLGVGINLGGGQREMLGTDLGVMIRDKQSNEVLWEGRATISVSDNSQLAETRANAAAIAEALFREFPGNNGETVEVKAVN